MSIDAADRGFTKETLESGQQPDTLESWVGQAIGAATMIDYGPTHPDTVFDDRSAKAILDWAVAGIRGLPAEPAVAEPAADIRAALARVLNSYSRENGSDTPDFILAQYLTSALAAFDAGVRTRDKWRGRPNPR